ncbi:MAG: WhiB family transcriptional regulator [Acidimicrobiia bacterium]
MTITATPTARSATIGATADISKFAQPIWRQYARCLGADSEIFYPPSESDEAAEPAKAICAACPVREACLEHAITAREKQGVWGGLTERERRRLIRQRRRTA